MKVDTAEKGLCKVQATCNEKIEEDRFHSEHVTSYAKKAQEGFPQVSDAIQCKNSTKTFFSRCEPYAM